MEASRAFQQGKPFLDDAAYDDLKLQLRRDRSSVVAQVRFLLGSDEVQRRGAVPDLECLNHQRAAETLFVGAFIVQRFTKPPAACRLTRVGLCRGRAAAFAARTCTAI